jgi:hypothetical protein
MKSILFPLAIALGVSAALPAMAEEENNGNDKRASCAEVAKDKWMTEDAIKAKAEELGYKVANMKTEDGCYEVYAIDKDGKKAEVFMHPGTGEVVHVEADEG